MQHCGTTSIGLGILLLITALPQTAYCFTNLDFEATSTPTFGAAITIPGWDAYIDGEWQYILAGTFPIMLHAHISLAMPESALDPLEGQYSISLVAGMELGLTHTQVVSIVQSGRVPPAARKITLVTDRELPPSFIITMNDVEISLTSTPTGNLYQCVGDISAFSGQEVELKATVIAGPDIYCTGIMIDSICFPVPEIRARQMGGTMELCLSNPYDTYTNFCIEAMNAAGEWQHVASTNSFAGSEIWWNLPMTNTVQLFRGLLQNPAPD